MPLLQPALLHELVALATDNFDAIVPTNDTSLPEPLCAIYRTSCIAAIESQVEADLLKVALFLDKVRTRYVPPATWRTWDPEGLSFLNINQEHDLQRAKTLLENAT
jgi:molybdopterin-guanine dinucleotide biosynthesis protein A